MAYPGDPSGPASKGSAFLASRLTPDDFEQLAAAFRPSWELDQAPFTGPGSMSPSELGTLQVGGGTHADIRAAAPLTNGAHGHSVHAAPKPGPFAAEPQVSVVVDTALAAAVVSPTTQILDSTPAPTPFGPPVFAVGPPPAVLAAPSPSKASADRLAQTRIIPRSAVPSIVRENTGSFDIAGSPFARRSPRLLLIAVGAGGLALAAAGVWSSSARSDKTAPPVPITVTAVPHNDPDIPPPPPEVIPPAIPPASKTAPAVVQVPTPAQSSASLPVRPAVAPTPTPAPAAPPRAAIGPSPKPAARPKGGAGTIVHDVPF